MRRDRRSLQGLLAAREDELRRQDEAATAAELARREEQRQWDAATRIPRPGPDWNMAAVRITPEVVAVLEAEPDPIAAVDSLVAAALTGARGVYATVGMLVSAAAPTRWCFDGPGGRRYTCARRPGGYLIDCPPVAGEP